MKFWTRSGAPTSTFEDHFSVLPPRLPAHMYHAQATVHGSRCQPPFSAGPLDRPVPVDESQRVFVEDGSPESDWIRLVIKKDRFPESDQSVRTLFFHPPPNSSRLAWAVSAVQCQSHRVPPFWESASGFRPPRSGSGPRRRALPCFG